MENLDSEKEMYKYIVLYETVALQLVVKKNLESVGKFTFQICSTKNRLMGVDMWWCDVLVGDKKVIYVVYQQPVT